MLVCSVPNVTLQACMEGIHVVIIELQGSVQLSSEIGWAGSDGLEGMKVDNNKPQRLRRLSRCSLCDLLAGVFAIESVVSRSTG